MRTYEEEEERRKAEGREEEDMPRRGTMTGERREEEDMPRGGGARRGGGHAERSSRGGTGNRGRHAVLIPTKRGSAVGLLADELATSANRCSDSDDGSERRMNQRWGMRSWGCGVSMECGVVTEGKEHGGCFAGVETTE